MSAVGGVFNTILRGYADILYPLFPAISSALAQMYLPLCIAVLKVSEVSEVYDTAHEKSLVISQVGVLTKIYS